jgi:hypothetical protein
MPLSYGGSITTLLKIVFSFFLTIPIWWVLIRYPGEKYEKMIVAFP